MTPVKRLKLEHAYNVRDMGGIETADGRITRWQRLYRSDSLHGLLPQEWKRLEDAGIKTVIDLRSSAERARCKETPPDSIKSIHCSMQKDRLPDQNEDEVTAARKAFGGSLTTGYRSMLLDTPHLLVCALKQVVCGLEKGAVLFHCTAGKDRTGVLAAALLFLLGADSSDIVAEYEVSYTYNRRGFFRFQDTMPNFKDLQPLLFSDAENMEQLVAFFKEINLADYLAKHDFSDADITRLKELTLENA